MACLIAVLSCGFIGREDARRVYQDARVMDPSPTGLKHMLDPDSRRSGPYLPVRDLSYMLDGFFWSANPVGYHLQGLLLHVLNALLVYFLACRWIGRVKGAALSAAALFAVHSIHVEAVAWISAREILLSAFFCLLCLHLWHSMQEKTGLRWWVFYAGVLCSALAALFAGPMALSLPLLLVLSQALISHKMTLKRMLPALPIWICAGFHTGMLLPWPGLKVIASNAYALIGRVWTLVVPIGLHPEVRLPVLSGLNDWRLAMILGWIVVAICAVVILVRYRKLLHKTPVFGMCAWCVLWYVGAFLPAVMLERFSDQYLYLPSVGVCLLAGLLLVRTRPNWGRGVCAGIVVFYFVCTQVYVRAWQDEIPLWRRTVQIDPGHFNAQLHLADAYIADREYPQANPVLASAMSTAANQQQRALVHHRYAGILLQQNTLNEAESHIQEALRVYPQKGATRRDAGILHYKRGEKDAAFEDLSFAKRRIPFDPDTNLFLGDLLAGRAEWTKAFQCYRTAASGFQEDAGFWQKYATAAFYADQYAAAEEGFVYMKSLDPENAERSAMSGDFFLDRGKALHEAGLLTESERAYSLAINMNPQDARPYYNLGILYMAEHEDEAAKCFDAALERDSGMADAHYNRGLIAYKKKDLALAAKHYSDVTILAPDNADAWRILGGCWYEMGDRKRAGFIWEKGLEQNPGDAALIRTLQAFRKNRPN